MQTDWRSTPLASTTDSLPQVSAHASSDRIVATEPLAIIWLPNVDEKAIHAAVQAQQKKYSFGHAHRRSLISLGLFVMVCFSFLSVSSLSGGDVLRQLTQDLTLFAQHASVSLTAHSSPGAPVQQIGDASQHLVRISQLDPAQYSSTAEYQTWGYSACSTASMTEVFNAYGGHYHITDVLRVETQLGEITSYQGLLRPEGIANTAAQFGFKTDWKNDWNLDQIIAIGNSGKPVIVGFPPDRYDGGHLLVLLGGDANSVFLADTSLWNHRQISRGQFLQWWGGFGAVVTPK